VIIKEPHVNKTDEEEQFAAWLATQCNSDGAVFKPNVANGYARNLRTEPLKLDIPLSLSERDVFRRRTTVDFDKLNSTFQAAPNFRDVNRGANHGAFSAGLAAYRRYLESFEECSIPGAVIDILNKDYASGFRFDTTYINLLSSASGVEVDARMQSALKLIMFRRDDSIYFLLGTVADAATRKDIVDFADSFLEEYGCFEMPEFYKLFEDKVSPKCIRNTGDFESFYEQIGNSGVRCVQAPNIGNRIARFSNGSVWGTFKEVAAKIVSVIINEYYGSCNEDDLHTKFCAFSTDLLGKIIKFCASEELIRVEINDSICYQTYGALGLTDDFSEVLANVLEQIGEVGLEPTRDVLHTSISLKLGVNFMAEFNLPDWDTFQRLIAMFYKGTPRREWKHYIFGEVTG